MDEGTRIISIGWREATASMTGEDFKRELSFFAGHVEQHKARGILVDVGRFRHKMGSDVQEWRVKNISNRYSAAGVNIRAGVRWRFDESFTRALPRP